MDLKTFIKRKETINKQLIKYQTKYSELEKEYIDDKIYLHIGDMIKSNDIIQKVDRIYVDNETNEIVYVMISNVLNINHGTFYKVSKTETIDNIINIEFTIFKQEYIIPTQNIEKINSENNSKIIQTFNISKEINHE